MARVLILLSVILYSVYVTDQAYFLQEEFIDQINAEASTWEAGVNFDPNTPEEQIKIMLGSRGKLSASSTKSEFGMHKTIMEKQEDSDHFHWYPKRFDARKWWPKCKTIGQVRDQGKCGSCWAMSTSSAFADRYCIATGGKFNQLLSAEEIAFCCFDCGFGCGGGWPILAWQFFSSNGLVTGGNYNTTDGCQPYRIPPCRVNGNNTCIGKPRESNHECVNGCFGNKELDYDVDHKFTRDFYYLSYNTIQKDMLLYGPVESTFEVYSDFPNYKSGVYVKTSNTTYLGRHSVKLIGWGEENGVPYWLAVNSWSNIWGDKGLFKIRRGTNECYIDVSATAGVPAVD